jgi:hypothetical protein
MSTLSAPLPGPRSAADAASTYRDSDLLQDPDVAQLPFDITAWCWKAPEASLPFVFNRRPQQQEQQSPPSRITNAMPRPNIGTVPEVTSASAPAPENSPCAPLELKREATDARGAPWYFTELPAGRFEVAERAGSGAFGLVYKAWDTVEYVFRALLSLLYTLTFCLCVNSFASATSGWL